MNWGYMIPERDLVDEVLDAIVKAEQTGDHIPVLDALRTLKHDFLISPYNHDPAAYVQNKALAATSEHVIGAGIIEQEGIMYHCLTLNLSRRRDHAKVEGIFEKVQEPVFKYQSHKYVIEKAKQVAGIVITKESSGDTTKLSARNVDIS